MKYHFNAETGKTAICEAHERECPLIHGESPEEAQAVYEKEMASQIVHKMSKTDERKHYQSLPAIVLSKTPLKELDAAQLSQTIRHEAISLGMDAETIDSAIDLATILHAHQMRGNRGNFDKTPYIEHPLRNCLRLIRLGVKDQDVIVAAILHDTIEDGATVFVKKFHPERGRTHELDARDQLGTHIKYAYGNRVLKLVDAVTNDYIADTDKEKMSLQEKNFKYLKHVEENVSKDENVFLVKISDFIDNATGLYHNDIPSRAAKTLKQAVKYLPVVKVFENSLEQLKFSLPAESIAIMRNHLRNTETRLKKIIEKYSEN